MPYHQGGYCANRPKPVKKKKKKPKKKPKMR